MTHQITATTLSAMITDDGSHVTVCDMGVTHGVTICDIPPTVRVTWCDMCHIPHYCHILSHISVTYITIVTSYHILVVYVSHPITIFIYRWHVVTCVSPYVTPYASPYVTYTCHIWWCIWCHIWWHMYHLVIIVYGVSHNVSPMWLLSHITYLSPPVTLCDAHCVTIPWHLSWGRHMMWCHVYHITWHICVTIDHFCVPPPCHLVSDSCIKGTCVYRTIHLHKYDKHT